MDHTREQTEKIYINAWNTIRGVGAQKLHMIARTCDSFASAWHADAATLSQIGFSHDMTTTIMASRPSIDPYAAWNALTQHDISLITSADDAFPYSLTTIPHPPFCLYVRGDLRVLSMPSVAVVGSRKITDYGMRATIALTREIAQHQIAIVSGLALGTDAAAHRAALDGGGITIAVLAGGIDDASIAPRTHINLAHTILTHGGALISEYPIGTTPQKGTFPARNRLMAALAHTTVIIEAAHDSGTLITARHAIAFKKPLFALPGSIFADTAVGPNMLLRDKMATPILSAHQITESLGLTPQNPNEKKHITFDDPTQQEIYDAICTRSDGIQIDHLIKITGHDVTTVSGTLTLLEIEGHIKNIGNQTYILL